MTIDLNEKDEKPATLKSIMDKEAKESATPKLEMGSNVVNSTLKEIGFVHFV
jgi:hypothetical protein